MYCFDNLSDLKFYGNFNTDNFGSVEVRVLPCQLGKKCKPMKDLKNAWPHLYTFANSQQYKKNEYNEASIIKSESELGFHRISTTAPYQKTYMVQRN